MLRRKGLLQIYIFWIFLWRPRYLKNFVNSELNAKNTTEIGEELIESNSQIGVTMTSYEWKMFIVQLSSCSAIAISLQRIRNYFSSTEVHVFLCFVGIFYGVFEHCEAILLASCCCCYAWALKAHRFIINNPSAKYLSCDIYWETSRTQFKFQMLILFPTPVASVVLGSTEGQGKPCHVHRSAVKWLKGTCN